MIQAKVLVTLKTSVGVIESGTVFSEPFPKWLELEISVGSKHIEISDVHDTPSLPDALLPEPERNDGIKEKPKKKR